MLNYECVADTLRCLHSLAQSTFRDQHVVVVDNGSRGDDAHRIRREVGAVTVLASPENLGYAGGNNLGIQRALEGDAEFVWVLNPDTVVDPPALAHLIDVMEAQPDIGIIGPRLTNANSRPPTIWFDGGQMDLARGGATWHENSGRKLADCPAGPPKDTGYVTGAAMLVRRRVFEEVGLLPEQYFLYFEETDFNLQAQAAGWRTVVASKALVHHYKRSSGRLPTPHYVYYFVRNRLLFGSHVTPLTLEAVLSDLQTWIDAWETKVRDADPTWLDTYHRLVAMAIDDAREGRTGPRDLDSVTSPASD